MSSFEEVLEAYKHRLTSFADGGYRFSGDYTLNRQSQQEAFQSYREGIEAGKTQGYIELPTGVGKTALFIALIKNYLDAANGSENSPRVLIAVPTEKLTVQTALAFAKFMPEIARTIETDGDESQEIDWEKSDIGLQYGKVKHAHKKPKVLITTYQSLARDTSNKIYPPEEYGLVIYDEGHVITAPTFGRAVNKFHTSVQLAVTATSEYSETKTVASKLAHRYFRLPLAEAVNRGDLCNVRPAIIKTGYTIDEKKFIALIEQQGGTPLNETQLEQLLNQEARNQAVIETYFSGADPDSGKRYLGQNGMIFCTAVKHADSITNQFGTALQADEYIQIREWLANEEIELIAAVHGKTQGAFFRKEMLPNKPPETRQYLGDKEWYSEEEIFDLHGRGKILLLASVAKLKLGYDSPLDSLLFDLTDRFSKLEATQIDGRAFRLDPEDPDKTATVFNLMDENTEELYRKYPKLIPIYCAEVIEGAEFRPPARRPKANIRFKEHPPEMARSLEESGFAVITDIDVVRTISRKNKERRLKAKEERRGAYTIEDVVESAKATFNATGMRPAYNDTRIAHGPLAGKVVWGSVASAIKDGFLSGAGYTSLVDLFNKNQIGTAYQNIDYTVDDVIKSARATFKATKKRPSVHDLGILHGPLASKTTWKAIGRALTQGHLKKSGYKSLAELLDRNNIGKSIFFTEYTIKDVVKSARATFKETQRRPINTDKEILYGPLAGKTRWDAVDASIRAGRLKDCGYKSLADALNSNNIGKSGAFTDYTIDDVIKSARATFIATKKRPSVNDREVRHGPLAGKTTWKAIGRALTMGRLTECGYKSLTEILDKNNIGKNRYFTDYTISDVIVSARATLVATQRRPSAADQKVLYGPLAGKITWASIEQAMLRGSLKDCDDKSLSHLFDSYNIPKRKPQGLEPSEP